MPTSIWRPDAQASSTFPPWSGGFRRRLDRGAPLSQGPLGSSTAAFGQDCAPIGLRELTPSQRPPRRIQDRSTGCSSSWIPSSERRRRRLPRPRHWPPIVRGNTDCGALGISGDLPDCSGALDEKRTMLHWSATRCVRMNTGAGATIRIAVIRVEKDGVRPGAARRVQPVRPHGQRPVYDSPGGIFL